MTVDDFEKQVILACMQSPVITSVVVSGSGVIWVRLRAYLVDGTFVEAYYNEQRGRTAFAWIADEKRIMGADDTGGWHWHPVEAPGTHMAITKAVSFIEFLNQVEAHCG